MNPTGKLVKTKLLCHIFYYYFFRKNENISTALYYNSIFIPTLYNKKKKNEKRNAMCIQNIANIIHRVILVTFRRTFFYK